MKHWLVYASKLGYGLICGECAEKHGESDSRVFITKCVIDSKSYTQNCDVCGKNCGDYYHRKDLAA